MWNCEDSAPVPFAPVALVTPVGDLAEVIAPASAVRHGLRGVETPAADTIVVGCPPDAERAVRDSVDRTSKFRESRVRKIPGVPHPVELRTLRAVRVFRLVDRSVVLPPLQVFRTIKHNTTTPRDRSDVFSGRKDEPVAPVLVVVKYVGVAPVQALVHVSLRDETRVALVLGPAHAVAAGGVTNSLWKGCVDIVARVKGMQLTLSVDDRAGPTSVGVRLTGPARDQRRTDLFPVDKVVGPHMMPGCSQAVRINPRPRWRREGEEVVLSLMVKWYCVPGCIRVFRFPVKTRSVSRLKADAHSLFFCWSERV